MLKDAVPSHTSRGLAVSIVTWGAAVKVTVLVIH